MIKILTFWNTRFTEEERKMLQDAINDGLYSLRKKVDCFNRDSCKLCPAKKPCTDLHKLTEFLDE